MKSVKLAKTISKLTDLDFSKDNFMLCHEAALASWNADNYIQLIAIDLFLNNPASKDLIAEPMTSLSNELEIPIRLWASSLGEKKFSEVRKIWNETYSTYVLSPEDVLETIDSSPDSQFLAEHKAYLAMLVHQDEMSDEEISEFNRYVRIH